MAVARSDVHVQEAFAKAAVAPAEYVRANLFPVADCSHTGWESRGI
jgi:hypothetical protein